jgi:hypothetical protein
VNKKTIIAGISIIAVLPSYAAGPVNNSGGGYGSNYSEAETKGSDKSFSQIKEGTAPTCFISKKTGSWFYTNSDGSYDKTRSMNNYFISPFPGCLGYKWSEFMTNCITGTFVFRFYGTLNAPTQAITTSRSGIENTCEQSNRAGLFYPNPMDSGVPPSEINISILRDEDGNTVYSYINKDILTSGPIIEKKGSCNSDFISNSEFKNRLEESIKENKLSSIKDELYLLYQEIRNKKFDNLLASLYINHDRKTDITKASDISLGSTSDCSSVFDYQQYIATGPKEKYKSFSDIPENVINEGTVVVGTCAIATERPARIYLKGGDRDYAFYSSKAENGLLVERYSKYKVDLSNIKDDNITNKYKDAIINSNFENLPKSYLKWPSISDINKRGSTAWFSLSEPDLTKANNFIREYFKCTYDIIKPVDKLLGDDELCEENNKPKPCPTSSPSPSPSPSPSESTNISGLGSGVYLVVESTLPKYYTASGELMIYNIQSKGRVVCDGGPCKSAPAICDPGSCPTPDPIIIDYNYVTDLIGVNGYRECSKKNQLKCDFYSTLGKKDAAIEAIFYSPSEKKESVKLVINSPRVRYIPQRYVEFCSPIVIGVDPETGEDIIGCEVKYRLVQDPERATNNYYHKKGGENKGVTGSTGS